MSPASVPGELTRNPTSPGRPVNAAARVTGRAKVAPSLRKLAGWSRADLAMVGTPGPLVQGSGPGVTGLRTHGVVRVIPVRTCGTHVPAAAWHDRDRPARAAHGRLTSARRALMLTAQPRAGWPAGIRRAGCRRPGQRRKDNDGDSGA